MICSISSSGVQVKAVFVGNSGHSEDMSEIFPAMPFQDDANVVKFTCLVVMCMASH